MPEFRHGLVIGKFYPPTPGHQLLIEAALARCDTVTVLVEHAAVESIPGELRAAWLRQMAPGARVLTAPCDVPMDLASDAIWAAHVDVIATALRYADPPSPPVDAVLSSEAYGPQLASRLAAVQGARVRSVAVDPGRTAVPISATAVRADPVGHWPLLHPAVRAGLAVRVCVIGAESTGTTTLARGLAEHYRARGGVWASTAWVPEYGRRATLDKLAAARLAQPAATMDDLVWTRGDFERIAAAQTDLEEQAAAAGSPLLVCDTDAFATGLWEERYLPEAASADLRRRFACPRKDIYLLTDHIGIPFEQDGIRDGEHLRADMTGWFQRALVRDGLSYALITGDRERRLGLAVRICDRLLDQRAAFAAPMT